MDVLKKIFKDNPELLDLKEVKELIEYSKKEYKNLLKKYNKYDKFFNFVSDKCFNSNVFLKKGNNCTWTVNQILEYIEKMD